MNSKKKISEKKREEIIKSIKTENKENIKRILESMAPLAELLATSMAPLINFSKNYGEMFQNFYKTMVKPFEVIQEFYKKRYNYDSFINNQKESYNKGNLGLIFGSGISVPAKIKDWKTLINENLTDLLKNTIVDLDQESIPNFINFVHELTNYDILLLADFLKRGLGEDIFTKKIKKSLYENYRYEDLDNIAIFNSISKFCKGDKINRIFTFNYDDLIEQKLKKEKISISSIDLHNILNEIDFDGLKIYHIHGYLPYNKENQIEEIILTETDYLDKYTESFDSMKITFHEYVKTKKCIFIGLSLNDPNLKRMLMELSKNKQKVSSYIILKDFYFPSKEITESVKDESFSDVITLLKLFYDKVMINKALELGLEIIWVPDYDKIPEILDKILEI